MWISAKYFAKPLSFAYIFLAIDNKVEKDNIPAYKLH